MVIKDLPSLKKFFKKNKKSIFGAGVYAFLRLGPEEFIPNYQTLSLYSSKETKLIKKDIPVFCLEEKVKKRFLPRNSTTLLSHSLTLKFLSRFENPLILVYKSSKKLEKISKKFNFTLAVSPFRFGKKLFEDKIKFRKILSKIKVIPTPGRIIPFSFLNFSSFFDFKKEFGLPFVIQHPRQGGGKGTFFIRHLGDFERVKKALHKKPTEKIIVAKFIEGPSPSITGCVTKFGILSTYPQYQICDIPILYSRPIGSGLFCGHDWSTARFSKKILSQAKETVERVGNYFKKKGYKGIFGIDFVQDQREEKLYVTECNPRLLGSMPALTMIELKHGIPPILAFHLLEYLEIPYEIDKKKILEQLWQKREGAQMLLCSPKSQQAIQAGEIEPGVYKIVISNRQPVTSKLKFLRPGYKFSHLKKKNEFLLTDGLLRKGSQIKPFQRMARILTQKRVLNRDLKDITPKTKGLIKLVIRKLKVI